MMRSGTTTAGAPSTNSTRFSFWIAIRASDARMIAEAREPRFAHREAAAQFAPHVRHLAGEKQRRAGCLEHALDDVLALGARIEDRSPDLERLGQRAGHGDLLDVGAQHRRRREARARAHVDRDMAGEALEPVHVDDLS